MKARYGDRAHTVINNHRATVVLSGVKDPSTLEHVSRLAGDSEVTRHSTATDPTGRRSTTEGLQYRRLAPTTPCAPCPTAKACSSTAPPLPQGSRSGPGTKTPDFTAERRPACGSREYR